MQRQTLLSLTALNQYNLPSPTGAIDFRTGLLLQTGGLTTGDYADFDETNALNNSNLQQGRLYAGRYRMVLVDPLATAANVIQGTVAYYMAGTTVAYVALLTQGSGQTPGVYQVPGVGGGGTNAVIQVTVNLNGTVTAQPVILNPGAGYTSTPTFTLVAGGTAATFAAEMQARLNAVTSYDKALSVNLPRAVFLNSVTPGNYTFVQELGIATVLGNATIGSNAVGSYVNGGAAGTVTTTAGTGSAIGSTIGQALDVPVASALFRCILTLPVVTG